MNELKPCRYGPMLFNRFDRYIGRSLQLYGEFSEGECDVFRQLVRPGATVLELGANIGAHTVPLARLAGESGRILAFEPQRIVFQTLCANIALNNLTNVHCFQQAVGRESGSIVTPHLDYGRENNFGGVSLGHYQHGERVPLVAIDDLQLPACHFIKIDIEGMEAEAIEGGRATLRRLQPILYVENDRPDRAEPLIRLLDDLGYAMYWHSPPLFNPHNHNQVTENIFGRIVSRNMICVPRSMPHQIDAPPVAPPGD